MKKLFLTTLILIVASTLTGASSFIDLTEIGIGARPLGMGRAFNSIVDDGSAIFMNPAGLTSVEKYNLISMSGNLLNEVPYSVVGGAWKTRYGYWGVGYISATAGGIKETLLINGTPEITGNEANFSTSSIILSYANDAKEMELINRIGFLTDRDAVFGANLKIISYGFSGSPSFEGKDANGFDIDIGTIFEARENTHISLTIKNILPGKNIKTDELPTTFVYGIANEIPEKNMLTALDIEYGEAGLLFHMGGEWNPREPIFIRAGLDQAPDGFDLTYGIGVKMRGFSFDYAYHAYTDLSEFSTHYFSLGYSK